MENPHIVLLGDSTFDNESYSGPGRAVIDHVRARLGGKGWARLYARDGAHIADVPDQFRRLRADHELDASTVLVLSIGGNDMIRDLPLLADEAATVGEALLLLRDRREAFLERYRQLLHRVVDVGVLVLACAAYEPLFSPDRVRWAAAAALSLYHDGVFSACREAGVPLLDLRGVINWYEDYFNPIEPSALGGSKIARAIVDVVRNHDFAAMGRRCVLYPTG